MNKVMWEENAREDSIQKILFAISQGLPFKRLNDTLVIDNFFECTDNYNSIINYIISIYIF